MADLGLHEWFPTPAWVVHRLLDRLDPVGRIETRTALDPCAGNGAIAWAVNSWQHGRLSPEWTEIDLKPRHDRIDQGDYLRWERPACPRIGGGVQTRFDLCIMNPPFSRAMEFAAKAQREARTVCMLHRLAWAASGARYRFLRGRMPSIYVLPNRPDFSGAGGASDDYAWFVWGPGRGGRWALLDLTPASERKPIEVIQRERRQLQIFGE